MYGHTGKEENSVHSSGVVLIGSALLSTHYFIKPTDREAHELQELLVLLWLLLRTGSHSAALQASLELPR